jgi:hypothetical protein
MYNLIIALTSYTTLRTLTCQLNVKRSHKQKQLLMTLKGHTLTDPKIPRLTDFDFVFSQAANRERTESH